MWTPEVDKLLSSMRKTLSTARTVKQIERVDASVDYGNRDALLCGGYVVLRAELLILKLDLERWMDSGADVKK